MSIDKIGGLVIVTCDMCGEELPELPPTVKEAIELLKAAGWSARKMEHEWENLCPACRED